MDPRDSILAYMTMDYGSAYGINVLQNYVLHWLLLDFSGAHRRYNLYPTAIPPNATTIPSIHREGGCSCHHTMIRHALKPIPRKELKNRKKEKQRFAGKKLDGAVLHNMLIVDGATLHLQLAKVNLFPLT